MADSEEMRRLILHAAAQLRNECDAHVTVGSAFRPTLAAMALAEGVLRMVAACMATETEALTAVRQAAKTAPRDEHGKFVKGGA